MDETKQIAARLLEHMKRMQNFRLLVEGIVGDEKAAKEIYDAMLAILQEEEGVYRDKVVRSMKYEVGRLGEAIESL